MTMTPRHWLAFAMIASLLVIAVIFIAGQNAYVFRFSEADLQEKLDHRLPMEETYMGIFDVKLDKPRVDLVEGSDRVAAGMDVVVTIRALGREILMAGAADLSGAVEYRSERGEFYLIDPDIIGLRIQGIPEKYSDRTHSVIKMALTEYYKTRPIYTFQDTKTSDVAARLLLRDVVVRDEELVVTLSLKKGAD